MFDILMYLISGVSSIAPPVIFVVFLINALIHIRKYKKGTEGKGKAVAYSIVSGVALVYTVSEVLLLIWFAAGIAHM